MKRKSTVYWGILWLIAIIPVIATLILYTRLPAVIPMHWTHNGTIDSWAPRFPNIFLMPAVVLVFASIMTLIPKLGPSPQRLRGLYLVLTYSIIVLGVVVSLIFLIRTLRII